MTKYLHARGIRIFHFSTFAKPLTETIKANAEALAAAAGIRIDYVRRKNFRKEDKIRSVFAERGEHPGLVWMLLLRSPARRINPGSTKRSGRHISGR